jgi:gamma-glutamyl-gamma-aminobutyrate hydrolase PuuD
MSYGRPATNLGILDGNISRFMATPTDYKLIIFTGGADVSPHMYGETSPNHLCGTNPARDEAEARIFKLAAENGILMTGICRGLQLLNVMSGGKMIHHLDGHAGSRHLMQTPIGVEIMVNSLHHQMILPPASAKVIGWSADRLSRRYFGDRDENVEYGGFEMEAAIFPENKAFGVQYHPEMMGDASEGASFYRQMLKNALSLPWDTFVTAYTKGLENVSMFELREHSYSAGR